jgi:chaperonin GroEL (HSP60 family)
LTILLPGFWLVSIVFLDFDGKDISKTQDDEVGDGTTTVAVLAGELLREADKLVSQRIHPQHIIEGWRKARDEAKKVLNEICINNFWLFLIF